MLVLGAVAALLVHRRDGRGWVERKGKRRMENMEKRIKQFRAITSTSSLLYCEIRGPHQILSLLPCFLTNKPFNSFGEQEKAYCS